MRLRNQNEDEDYDFIKDPDEELKKKINSYIDEGKQVVKDLKDEAVKDYKKNKTIKKQMKAWQFQDKPNFKDFIIAMAFLAIFVIVFFILLVGLAYYDYKTGASEKLKEVHDQRYQNTLDSMYNSIIIENLNTNQIDDNLNNTNTENSKYLDYLQIH